MMHETEFNQRMRSSLHAAGLQAMHIREADVPGVTDLLVWHQTEIVAWMELKVDDEEVRVSQKEFLRARDKEGALALVLRYSNKTELISVFRANRQVSFTLASWSTEWYHALRRWKKV